MSTAEWQSFELRMRRRRAQRCLLNAETAFATGSINAARDALEEARRLDGPPDEIARIQSLIDARTATAPASATRLSWRYVAAAAVVLAGTAFAATTFLKSQPPAAGGSTQAAQVATPPPAAVTLAVQNIPAASSTPLAEGTSGPDATTTPLETAEDATAATDARIVDTAQTQAPAVPEVRLEEPTPAAIAALPPPDPPAASPEPASLQQAIITTTPAPTRPAVDPVPELRAPQPESNAPAASPNASPVGTVPTPAEKDAVPPRDESAEIRGVLAQYERAYNRLDPSLARSVWPGVDERALARAFGNLVSQRIVLQRCDVTTDGDTAQAVCTGSATWTPKVGGGGARTQNRRWTFDLLKEGDAWQINRAVVR